MMRRLAFGDSSGCGMYRGIGANLIVYDFAK